MVSANTLFYEDIINKDSMKIKPFFSFGTVFVSRLSPARPVLISHPSCPHVLGAINYIAINEPHNGALSPPATTRVRVGVVRRRRNAARPAANDRKGRARQATEFFFFTDPSRELCSKADQALEAASTIVTSTSDFYIFNRNTKKRRM